MKTLTFIIVIVGSIVVAQCNSICFSADLTYKKKSELICDTSKIQITTRCDDIVSEAPPQCGEQTLVFAEIHTGKKTSAPSYGLPHDSQFENAGIANAWRCIQGNDQSYITLWYSTGGNCEECDWQGLLDLKGNRILTDINKNNRTFFALKWSSLGLPALEANDFTEIRLKKNE